VEQFAKDLQRAFPEMKGFSARNLKYMQALADTWPDDEFVQQAVAQIPWFHNVVIPRKLKEPAARRFYVEHTRINGWSRAILEFQIEQRRHLCQGRAPSNFERTPPPPQSDLAQRITKDPYCFDFLTLADDAHERELERGLVEHIRDFLVELGVGFAFMGTQVHLGIVTRTPTMRAAPRASSPIAPGKG
jgi:predicted nuclease of restriction endonuclease-like (RecB) superfamily